IQADGQAVTTKEIYDRLVNTYQGEGQFSFEKMEEHLLAIKAVALIEAKEAYIDDDGEARYKYAITEAGRARRKYLPTDAAAA
ncbi:MAG: hypothetical protein LBS31_07955, partial [Candidatus Adiutrix sp.]|nr:hypothetical protein [Candidatus Adiutrix sp.]